MQTDPDEVFKRHLGKNQDAGFNQDRTMHYGFAFFGKLRVTDVSFLLKVGPWLVNEKYLNPLCLKPNLVEYALKMESWNRNDGKSEM